MNATWKEHYKLHTFDVDLTNRVKISSIFNFMQESASNSANSLGFGYDQLIEEQLFWVLSRAKIEFLSIPSLGDEILIETWPRGIDKLFALRDFLIYDGKNSLIAKATTSWLMIDHKTKRPLRTDSMLQKIPQFETKNAIEEICGKIVPCPNTELIHEARVNYVDIDINQHLNNVKYIEYILNCFPIDNYKSRRINRLQVNFLCESKYNDTLRLFKGNINEEKGDYYIEGINQNEQKVFQASIGWDGKF
ncbi:MAG: thioesterase [Bacteroidota bacterium]|nr:thioesterase [Bacteroidota bacterium]